MATKKKAPATKKRVPKTVPGTNREHRMIDSRAEREATKRKPKKEELQ